MDEERIRRHAYQLWEEAGKPDGRDSEFWERAKELAAIEENQSLATKPRPTTAENTTLEPVEPAEAIENQGDFPGMADQGEEQPRAPRRQKRS
ncbi:DUF2934 domain-containing protein [Dongia soli]|uniref:DUF2934 domain-containing protein n=1 Tax=Dongia soli TaxID=600628 RepID=A0ABU5E607_9PROT|nr:DUF2934 domain-containing protein [Dongia soli]MDY0881633.1 DUF2934 domain-containing protein [Dongia soli]